MGHLLDKRFSITLHKEGFPIKNKDPLFSEERHERATICYESLTTVKQMLQGRQHHQPLTSDEQGKVRSALVELAVF